MDLPIPPWRLVIVRYCPACRLSYPRDTVRCERCGRPLVDQERREPVHDR